MDGNHINVKVRFPKEKQDALVAALAKQGSTLEEKIEDMVYDLYAELVPVEEQEHIRQQLASALEACEADVAAWRERVAASKAEFSAARDREGDLF